MIKTYYFWTKYINNEQQEEEAVEDGTYKHEYFHDDTEGIIKKYLKYKNKYLEYVKRLKE